MDDVEVLAPPVERPVQSYRSGRARAGHVVLIALAWLAFGWLWLRALQEPDAVEDLVAMVSLILLLAAVVLVLTYAWVVHNVSLARRRGGRRSGAPAPARPEHDLLGRRLLVDDDATSAGTVVVDVLGGAKTFRTTKTFRTVVDRDA